MNRRLPFSPAVLLSLAMHAVLAVWAVTLPSPPAAERPPPLDIAWLDLVAMPGTGQDLLAGGGGGGSGDDAPTSGPEGASAEDRAAAMLLSAEQVAQALAEAGTQEATPPVGVPRIDPIPGIGPSPLGASSRRGDDAREADLDPGARARRQALLRLLVDEVATGGSGSGAGSGPGRGGGTGSPLLVGQGTVGGRFPDAVMVLWLVQVQTALSEAFTPLPVVVATHPDAEAHVVIGLDVTTGVITEITLTQESGIASFDASALAAVRAVGMFPTPPAAWRDALESGLLVRFRGPGVKVGR